MDSFGFEPPPVVSLPGALYENETLVLLRRKLRYGINDYLPEGLIERCGMASHYFGPRLASLLEDLIEVGLAGEAVDVIRRLRRYQQVLLLADEAVVRRLGQLVGVAVCGGSIMDLLKEVVLVLAHYEITSVFLALFELVLE